MEFFYVAKATQKSGKPDAVVWFTAKTEARASLQLDVYLEDAGIETGRGQDYNKPVRTDFPVYNDLPEEGKVDLTWCERYMLQDDGRTWLPVGIPDTAKPATEETTVQEPVTTAPEQAAESDGYSMQDRAFAHKKYTFEQRVIGTWLYGLFDELSAEQKAEITKLAMDMDATYPQNVLLASRNSDVRQLQHVFPETIVDLFRDTKSVWPSDGKAPQLSQLSTFFGEWLDAHNNNATGGFGEKPVRDEVTAKWIKKSGSQVIARTDTGTNAGGGIKTDRSQDYEHTLDTLDIEIALALLPFDFDIYNFPASVHRRAKEIVTAKESPFKEWSAALRKCAGILDYSRAAIFALIRQADPSQYKFPGGLQEHINKSLTEYQHDKPTAEILAAARQIDSAAVVAAVIQGAEPVESLDKLDTPFADVGRLAAESALQSSIDSAIDVAREMVGKQLAAERGEFVEGISDPADPKWDKTPGAGSQPQPHIQRVSKTVFSIDGLMGSSPSNDAAHVKQEEKSNIDLLKENCPTVTAAFDEPVEPQPESDAVPVYPAYFEPGRYEGLPNNVYHAANGTSSTQVKDARVSLMYFHGRHISKTIGRETSDALTFGTLVHTLALEPDTFDEEFAVFPGVPAGAFTNTDTLKSFIREYNTDKPKAEQLKLTGKKEELQEAIRAVKPDAVFADEFEQQWREENQDKTILSAQQLAHAKAIQQALFSHPSASQLLQHPGRENEVSYFGLDESTGLEVRVRPDLEIDMSGLRIGLDLKTISLGKVKQDFLRARLHREIIDRDYHISAAMYCDVADFNQFFWIFVNKDEGYHWVAIIEASEELLELGRLEYRKTITAISTALDTDQWPAPITEDYTDELNDFDVRRLESLRAQANA